ncbi:MAG: hypothetical protein JEZ08_13270 [Clostridiales bacterium]|nr:hypothetical protein [Clostridiales bacterium]
MTKVFIAYNPFKVQTTIIINDEAISSTSRLFRYRKTPMQDWVEVIVKDIVDHCNDDVIEITFKGLKFNYKQLETQVDQFSKVHRDIELNLIKELSKSQIGRIGELSTIIDELLEEPLIIKDQLKGKDFLNENISRVLVISSNNQLKKEFMDVFLDVEIETTDVDKGTIIIDKDKKEGLELVDDEGAFTFYESDISFAKSKHSTLQVVNIPNTETQSSTYYRYTKKAIQSDEKPMVIIVLESDIVDNNEEFLSMIAKEYKRQGQQNKHRFIFIAEDPEEAKDDLYTEFAIKNTPVFSLEDIKSVQNIVQGYISDYNMIRKVNDIYTSINDYIRPLKEKILIQAEMNMKTDEMDAMYQDALRQLNQFKKDIEESHLVDLDIEKRLEHLKSDIGKYFSNFTLSKLPEDRDTHDENWSKNDFVSAVGMYLKNHLKKILTTYFTEISSFKPFEIENKHFKYGLFDCDKKPLEAVLSQLELYNKGVKKSVLYMQEKLKHVSVNQLDMSIPSESYYPKTYFVDEFFSKTFYETREDRGTTFISTDHIFNNYYEGITALTVAKIEGINRFNSAGLFGGLNLFSQSSYIPTHDDMAKVQDSFEFYLMQGRKVFEETFTVVLKGKDAASKTMKIELDSEFFKYEEHIKSQYEQLKKQANVSEEFKNQLLVIDSFERRIESTISL